MPDRHALLGASSAHRWLACTKSARLEENIPSVSTPYAAEGTKAHSMCELKLRRYLSGNTEPIGILEGEEEMDAMTEAYKDFVIEELNAAKANTPDAKLLLEQELKFDEYVPEGFGTSDAVIVSDNVLEVIDFKYGKGVVVDCENNPQLRLYGLGAVLALGSLYEFDRVKMVIYQPRVGNISTEEIDLVELLDWAANYLKPRAKLAYEGKGHYITGEHCRFCRAASRCRKRAEEAFKVIDDADTNPDLLSDEEIETVLGKLDDTENWIESVRAYALDKAVKGHKWNGYKLVESRTNRKIPDQIEAVSRLTKEGFSTEEVTNTKLKGITELERLLSKAKFNDILGDLVVKPEGKPTLVSNTDKRQEISPLATVFKEN